MSEYLVFQVQTVMVSTVLIVAVLGMAHPFRIVRDNYKMIASESVVIFILDMLLFASDPNTDPEGRSYIGFAIIGALGTYLFFSQGSLLLGSFQKIKLSCKRRIALKRRNKLLA